MLSFSSQNWSNIKKPVSLSVQWPVRRRSHAASHITGPVFVMSGGVGGGSISLNDMGLYDTNQWIKVFHMTFSQNDELYNRLIAFLLLLLKLVINLVITN